VSVVAGDGRGEDQPVNRLPGVLPVIALLVVVAALVVPAMIVVTVLALIASTLATIAEEGLVVLPPERPAL
jgi:hypothetical protein